MPQTQNVPYGIVCACGNPEAFGLRCDAGSAPSSPYIVDFVSFEGKPIVEIDGSQHATTQADYDSDRDAWLMSQGFRVLRFWNTEALHHSWME